MDALAAGWHDERVKKSAKGELFSLQTNEIPFNLRTEKLRWPSWSKAPD
jgi:hypothetical protein